MNRCVRCSAMRRFYGISQTPSEGWVRWTVCDNCGLYHKDNTERIFATTEREPGREIFRSSRD